MSADITEERIAKFKAFVEKNAQAGTLEIALMEALKATTIARSQLAALQSVPQGVEVPRISAMLLEQIDRASNGYEQMADALNDWVQPRLVHTPPQAAPGAVDVVLDPPKSDRDCGDCTRLAICNGELACLCGPTGKMFDRKAPGHPLQPEERRVGPDEVVVGREYLDILENAANRFCASCRDKDGCTMTTRHLGGLGCGAWRLDGTRINALRTSAQDHNGEGAR